MRATGVLLGDEIKSLNIISSGAADLCFKAASYDLRVGDQYVDPAENIDDATGKVRAAAIVLNDKPIIVPAYSSIVVSSHEILKIPGDVIGKFNLRIRWALRGLFVQMGTQVEPHYYGRLFAVLHNITSEKIEILRKDGNDGQNGRDRLFTIEFFKIGKSAPGQSPALPIDMIPDFTKNTSFAQSAINVMFKKSQSFESDLRLLRSSVTETIEGLKAGLVSDAQRVLASAQAQVDATKSMSDLAERYGNEAIKQLDSKFDEKITKIEVVENKIGGEIADLKRSKKELWFSVIVGAVIVLLASALIPFFISFAVSKTVPSFDSMLNPVRDDVSHLQTKVEMIASKSAEDTTVRSFQATISAQQRQIEELVKRLDAVQTQLTKDKAPADSSNNGGQAR